MASPHALDLSRAPGAVPVPPPVRLGLLDRYLLRVVVSRFLLCLGLIFAIMMLERTLRLATQMAAAGAHLSFLGSMILNLAPHYLGLALPPALLLATLLGVMRLDVDLEVEAMLAGGFPLRRIIAVFAGLGLAVALAGLLVIGFLEPMGRYGFRLARDEAANAGWTARLQPLAFQRRGGGVVVTADVTVDGGHRLGRVFIRRATAEEGEAVLTAAAGELRLAPDRRTVLAQLTEGRFHLERPAGRASDGRFAHYELTDPYAPAARTAARGQDAEELTITELAAPKVRQRLAIAPKAVEGEMSIRLARLAALPLLPLLALPLGLAGRQGRAGGSLALAGIMIMGFHECLRVAQSLSVIWDGSPGLAIWSVLLAFAALVAWVFLSSYRLQGERRLAWLVQQLQRLIDRRPRLVLRAPWPSRLSLGGYVTRRLTQATFAAWAGLTGMLATIDLFERTDEIMARGLGAGGLAHYGLMRLPVIAEQTAPLAVLAGAVTAYIGLARWGELIALRGLGVSPAQILRMSLPVALAVSCLVALLAEQVAPRAQLNLAAWWRATAPGPAAPEAGRLWFRVGDEIVTAAGAERQGARLERVVIYRRGADGLLAGWISARAAELGARGWRLRDARMTAITEGRTLGRSLGEASWPAHLRAGDVRVLAAAPLQVSAVDSLRALRGRAGSDQSRGFLLTRLHRAVAEPLAPIIMLLLALPLAKATSRSDPPGPYLAWALLGGLVYVVADGVLAAAAQTGLAPVWLGAWLAPVVFTVLAAAVAVFRDD